MKPVRILCLFCIIAMNSYSQAFVWGKSIGTRNNGVTTDPNENVIVFGVNAAGTTWILSKYTKDAVLIWTREFTKQGTYNYTPKASVVADHNGNIYMYDEGFDSINHVFSGHVLAGITKMSPNGTMTWHKEYTHWVNQSPGGIFYYPVTKVDLQIDAMDNIYCIFTSGFSSFSPGTVTLGTTNVPVPTPNSSIKGCLAVGSLQPDGTTRWLRVFPQQQNTNALVWEAAGAGVYSNRLFIGGHQNNGSIYFDNGLTLSNGRSCEWLVALNTGNGQSIWGANHILFYFCNGQVCQDPTPGLTVNPVTGQPVIIGSFRGAFVFKLNDTVRSQKINPILADTARSYYAVYDSVGTPVKANTYHGWGLNAYFTNLIASTRGGDYFTFYTDTIVKLDTGFNVRSMAKTNTFPDGLYTSKYTNDLFVTYPYQLRKMVDSAGVISGKTYADWNNNGIYDAGDSALNNILVSTNNSVVHAISSNDSGKYQIYAAPATYTITANSNHPYYTFLPATHTATITQYSDTVRGKDFSLRPLFNFTDVSVRISALNIARRGWNTTYNVTVKNFGPIVTPISVGLKIPPSTTYVGAGGGGSTVTVNAPDSITISFAGVDPFQTKTSQVVLLVSTSAVTGDTLKFYPIAYPYTTDTLKYNNRDTLLQVIRGSFDPNEKEVNATKQLVSDTAKALVYTVHFQNTGTDTAFYVRIADTLSAKLDANTFNYIDASHIVTTEIKNNVLNFIFNPIALPDSNHNEPLSHGFVKFSVKPKSPVNVADTMYNNAAIYFDFNAPVITNSTKSWYYINGPLPVILKSFVAEKKMGYVLLKFVTAAEPNFKNFIIERSTDGTNFSPIGTIASRGDATTGSSYTFNDNSPGQGINFYRLKMLDIDGRFTYSWILIVQFPDKDQPQVKVFPNPAGDNLYINFSNTAAAGTFSCMLVDAAGKTVWASDINPAIRNTLSINTSSFADGIYLISVKNAWVTYRQKVIIKH
jgi:uncharacterized repeat protein (TIGR01451 family)